MAGRDLAVILLKLKQMKAYFAGVVVNLLDLLVYLAVQFYLWSYVQASGASIPMNVGQLVSYYAVAFVLSSSLADRSDAREFSRLVIKGRLNRLLVQPVSLLRRRFLDQVGIMAFNLLVFSVPSVAVFILFGQSITLLGLLLFFWFLVIGFFVSVLLYFMLGALAFWTENTRHILGAAGMIFSFMAGLWVPLSFLPGWFQSVSAVMPFRYTVSIPANALLGRVGLSNVISLSVIGLVWILVLYFFSQALISRGLKRYSGYGA